MSRHAFPWTHMRRLADLADMQPSGRHRLNVSSTHIPAWPFSRTKGLYS